MAVAGRMGWSESQFLRSSLRYFVAAWKGVQRTEQEAWERTRWHAWLLLQPYMEKGKSLDISDLARFPWEPQPKAPVIDAATLDWLRRFSDEADRALEQTNPEAYARIFPQSN